MVGWLIALLIFGLQRAPARADPAPAPDYVETCTIEKQQHPGEECLMCSAWHGDPAKCLKRLSSRGYERRCRGDGASVWSEAWCRPLGAGGKATPTVNKTEKPL